ncbi:MAG TPA: hypothetical protein PLR07_16045 [Promineifilum sp.]|nr:hypothetical protein [Promineifilum sp.]
MKSSILLNVSGIASVVLSGLGFIIALILVPLIRVLPERTGLPTFMILMPSMIVCALTGMILGGVGLMRGRKQPYLSGLLLGAAALVIYVVIIIVA